MVYTRFGGPEVLHVVEAPVPSPKHDEVLIRVHATTVTSAETGMRQGRPLWGRVIIGFTGPRRRMRTLGIELAGTVSAVGRDVPVHLGLGDASRVDVQVTFPAAGKRTATWRRNVSPAPKVPLLVRTR